jgi:hypothetical protein
MTNATNRLNGAATVVRPTFIFIGADRCGSKSLHNIFRQHPDCFVPPIADPLFFDENYHRGLEWYFSLFAAAPPTAKAIGEFSHNYIHYAEAARRIAADLPSIQLLATLRHPAERSFSSYASAFSSGLIRTSFEQALDEVPMLIQYSLYADELDVYLDLFDRQQIKVLFFDDLQANPKAFAAEAFQFVGLRFIDEIDYYTRVSVLDTPRFPLAGHIRKRGARLLRRLGWVNLLGRLKTNPRLSGVFCRRYEPTERPQMSPETRKRLNDIFAPQIDRLEKMLGRDLSNWRV